jgi:hypothetical protein
MSINAATSNMREIIDLYRKAADQYTKGNLIQARTGFFAIISIVRSYDGDMASRRETGEYYDCDVIPTNDKVSSQLSLCPLRKPIEDANQIRCTFSSNEFLHFPSNETHSTITSRYIGFFDGIVPLSNDVIYSIESLVAVLIYNLAVVTHSIGLCKSNDCQSFLFDKTRQLYSQAQSLLDIWFTKSSSSIDLGLFTLINAAINSNMAQIYRDYFLDTKIADRLIHNLKIIIDLWREECFPEDMIPDRYFDLFASHIQFSQHLNIQTAPIA